MAVRVVHKFVSAVPNAWTPGANDIVMPYDWNDEHEIEGLGTAAEADTGDFATAAQGALADTAVQPDDLAAYQPLDSDLEAIAAQPATAPRTADVGGTDSKKGPL